ncbi:hypothetical protein [Rhodanobacter denitrificans]|uniref:Uncharacterized protein n=1 Tax=Rhodanobacter denitrificans TaxID=666685 RepID=M4NHG0_9GAMM|nr:hypothetical protein [Rhodanobacter denitrificans]AGG89083.1 hypothetical protein R2APBS1_1960 [Rhodanobacter denitrificans]UJJ53110.1 hypothetical protein LRK52_18565 [Rhodanobacter denitrificans]
MGPENPILAIASALHAARLRDLPVIVYDERDWERYSAWSSGLTREERAKVAQEERATGQPQGPTVRSFRRAAEQECLVTVFPQLWGSTALGYGGIGGAAMTTAYTVVVEAQACGQRAVYFGSSGRLAYLVPIDGPNEEAFRRALESRRLPSVQEAQALGWPPEPPSERAAAPGEMGSAAGGAAS